MIIFDDLVLIAKLTESRIFWEASPWLCLPGIILIMLIDAAHFNCGWGHSLGLESWAVKTERVSCAQGSILGRDSHSMAFPAVVDWTLQLQAPLNPLLSWGEPFSQLDLSAVPHTAKPGLGNERALGKVSLSSASVYARMNSP